MIIGLVGFIGSGKGTVGEYLHLEGYHQASFAGALKDTASTMFGWDRALLEGDTNESREFREQKDTWWSNRFGYDFTPRLALQLLGTEAGRDVFHKDLWIYSLEKRIEKFDNVVLTDTRFPNEIEFIRKLGGVIVQVERGKKPQWYETALKENQYKHAEKDYILYDEGQCMEQKYPTIHISEWAWIGQKIDYTIKNDSTLEDLFKSVRNVLTEVNKRDNIVTQLHNGENNEVVNRNT
ncbi:hypothetical protein UFOVP250_174 [uncultured Caudovirales phage]|uniref:Deoxynucleoside monophosphate kinase n=1 Tax=uncultured Caudovirales phage TaxID=2100421 RepID=A0A6J5LFS3_9CAUD|nr:hypothetical protein UFOVP250_174 [uncultured Caudovirales phage]